jgi:hypothetical protein
MTATVVHIGDTHLYDNARQADRLRVLDQILDETEPIDDLAAYLWPGDLFHARSTIDTRNALRNRVRRAADRAPVVICYGNHDVPGDLDIFGDLAARHPIYVVATPRMITLPTRPERPQITLFVLPYPTATGLVARGVAAPDIPAAARAALHGIFIDAGAGLDAARRRGDITLTIGHANLTGAVASIGQPAIGAEIELDAGLLAQLGEGYVGLSHIHLAQALHGAHYPGSICRLDWGEVEPKSYLRVQYTSRNIVWDGQGPTPSSWAYTVQLHPVAVAPMYHVEGDLSRDGFAWKVTQGPGGPETPAPVSWRGCEVRVRARYKQREGIVLATAKADVLALFAEADRCDFEPVCVPDRGLRAPEVAAARTLPDKLAAWATVTGVTLPATAGARMADLETTDADVLVAAAEARMRALLELPPADPVGPFVDRLDEQQYQFHAEAAAGDGRLPL